jgi:hypothetical protein
VLQGKSVSFDDDIEGRLFDNWQFIDFHAITAAHPQFPEPAFALAALEEVPTQFKVASSLQLHGYNNPFMALPVTEAVCLDPLIPDGPRMTATSTFFNTTSGSMTARFQGTTTHRGNLSGMEDTAGFDS